MIADSIPTTCSPATFPVPRPHARPVTGYRRAAIARAYAMAVAVWTTWVEGDELNFKYVLARLGRRASPWTDSPGTFRGIYW